MCIIILLECGEDLRGSGEIATTLFPYNPYDPLIQIFEHGGNLNKEHGQFIDVFDNHGKMVCGVTVRRA